MLCEIPIPDGWEFVGYRRAVKGSENWLAENNKIGSGVTYTERIIIRKKWQPPDFLPDGWIAMDQDGYWYWFASRPVACKDFWDADAAGNYLGIELFIWDRPPVTDWKESLREIKRNQAQPKVAS